MNQDWQNPRQFPSPWVRSPDNVLGGVCAGIADKLGVNPLFIRLFWVGLVLCAGTGVFLYLALWISLPIRGDYDALTRPVFLGVCSRIAQKWKWDIGLTRFAFVMATALSLGLTLLVYLAIHFFMPSKNSEKIIYK
ncbi:MAG: PspC domain-containing protein [Bdellovibrionales bacterium]|nr:PspC domain-containing protein [Bdellovibrionales bacterium]